MPQGRSDYLLRLGHNPIDPTQPPVVPPQPVPSAVWSQQQKLLPTSQELVRNRQPAPIPVPLQPSGFFQPQGMGKAGPAPGIQGIIPPDAQLRSRQGNFEAYQALPFSEKVRQAREQIGQIIQPLVGLDPQTVKDLEDRKLLMQIIMFHGSPFPELEGGKFDIGKMSTGEGGQAFGWGLPYIAQNPAVSENYLGPMTPGGVEMQSLSVPEARAAKQLEFWQYLNDVSPDIPYQRAIQNIKQEYAIGPTGKPIPRELSFAQIPGTTVSKEGQELIDILQRWKQEGTKLKPSGQLWRMNIPDEQVPLMLDWDRPVSEQSKPIQDLANQYGLGDQISGRALYDFLAYQEESRLRRAGGVPLNLTEAQRQRWNIVDESRKAASLRLRDLGVPGIKYWDQGSRSAEEGTQNMVIFDPDKSVEDLRKTTRGAAQVEFEAEKKRLERQRQQREYVGAGR